MTGTASSWFAKVGPWTALLCAGLALMAAMGVVQIIFVRQMAENMLQSVGYDIPGTSTFVGLSIASIVIRIALYLIGFGLLASQFQRSSVTFVVAAVWVAYPGLNILFELLRPVAFAGTEWTTLSGPPLQLVDLVLNLAITAYLLFSRRVAEVYKIDTRTRIPATLRKLWAQARGRPIPEEIEASRLHETFK